MRSIITILDYLILDNIDRKVKNFTTQIGKDLGYSQSTISVNIQKFYDSKLVDYDTKKADRTKKWYYLTEKGRTFLSILRDFDLEELNGK